MGKGPHWVIINRRARYSVLKLNRNVPKVVKLTPGVIQSLAHIIGRPTLLYDGRVSAVSAARPFKTSKMI